MAWNRSSVESAPVKKVERRKTRLCPVLGVLCLVLGVGAYFIFSSGDKPVRVAGHRAPGAIKEVKPAAAPKARPVETNAESKAEEPRRPLTEKEKQLAEIKEKIKHLNPRRIPPPNPYKTATDQVLAMLFSIEPGMRPMPFPPLSKKERENIVGILVSKIPINEEDSERLRFQKETVNEVKKEMLKYIKEGGDPDKFIDYYQTELNRLADKRELAVSESMKIRKSDPELYHDYVTKINEKLKAEGIREIPERPPYEPKEMNK